MIPTIVYADECEFLSWHGIDWTRLDGFSFLWWLEQLGWWDEGEEWH